LPPLPEGVETAVGLVFHDGVGAWVSGARQGTGEKDKGKTPPHTARNRGGSP